MSAPGRSPARIPSPDGVAGGPARAVRAGPTHRWRWSYSVALVLAACASVATAVERSAEHAELAAQRQRLEAGFAAEEAQCRERFTVTTCVDDVRKRKREALAAVRSRELVLDDAERRQRAAERRQAVARKQAELASRPAPADSTRHAPPGPTAGASGVPRTPRPPQGDAEAQEARRRADASRERRAKAEAQRDRIATRQADRARNGKAAQPLPLPPEVAASARPR